MNNHNPEGTSVSTPTAAPAQPAERMVHPQLAGRVATILPARPDMTPADMVKLADSLIGVGMRLAGMVHDEDPQDAAQFVAGLAPDRVWALPYVMAAMIDIERTATELLAWAPFTVPNGLVGATGVAPSSVLLRARPRPTQTLECGTPAAWERHVAHGEEPCDACWIAHRGWEADKKQRERDARKGRPPQCAAERARERATAEADRQAEFTLFTTIDEESSNAA